MSLTGEMMKAKKANKQQYFTITFTGLLAGRQAGVKYVNVLNYVVNNSILSIEDSGGSMYIPITEGLTFTVTKQEDLIEDE